MRRRLSAQQGMAMMSVLSVILVLVIVGAFTSIALWSLGYLIRQDAGGG